MKDTSPAILDRVKLYTVGFALPDETPATKGSGVLVRFKDQCGILTCAHVEDNLRAHDSIGLVNLSRGSAFQSGMLDLKHTLSFYRGDDPWPATGARYLLFSPPTASIDKYGSQRTYFF